MHYHPGYANANYLLAASLGHLDRRAEARTALDECERVQPGFAAKRREWKPYSNPANNEHILDGLRKAGLPEWCPRTGDNETHGFTDTLEL